MPLLQLVTTPPVEPITLAEAREYARIPHNDEDALVTSLIKVARQKIDGRDGILSRALVRQTWDWKIDRFDRRRLDLPLAPLQAVDSIKFRDPAGVEQTLDPSAYLVLGVNDWGPGQVELAAGQGWPGTNSAPEAITIRFTCGYPPEGDDTSTDYAANIPEPLKLAMKIMVAAWFENRESLGRMPESARDLLTDYRVNWV